jgi:hypothetical protein
VLQASGPVGAHYSKKPRGWRGARAEMLAATPNVIAIDTSSGAELT